MKSPVNNLIRPDDSVIAIYYHGLGEPWIWTRCQARPCATPTRYACRMCLHSRIAVRDGVAMRKSAQHSLFYRAAWNADSVLNTILSNSSHVLHTFVSERPDTTYSLRTRSHNKLLIPKTSDLGDRHFIIRSLYKNLY